MAFKTSTCEWMLKDTVISVWKGVADWYDWRGWLYTRHVPAEGALAGINDLCEHHGVSTHYYCSEES